MGKAEQNKFYKVIEGDRIKGIEAEAYGYYQDRIVLANSNLLQGRGISAEGLPIIYAGDRLWIPPLPRPQVENIEAILDNEITIRIEGKIFKGWKTASITRSLKTCADSFTFIAPYDPDFENSKILDPYSYNNCDLFVGGEGYLSGEIILNNPGNNDMSVTVRSRAGTIVDCMSYDKSLNYNNQTLKQIADKILIPFGILTEFPDGDTDPFVKVNRGHTETIFSFLSNLARQKGLTLTSSLEGKIIFARANVEGDPIANLIQGKQPLTNVNASYDSSKRFSDYRASTQTQGRARIKGSIIDTTIDTYRPFAFSADNTTSGNIKDAAAWKRSKDLANSAPTSAIVKSWRDKNADLWIENNIVTVFYPKKCIFQESRYLIETISLSKTAEGGDIATLGLVLPQAYTLDFPELEELPWRR